MYPNQSVANNGVQLGANPMTQQNLNYNGMPQQQQQSQQTQEVQAPSKSNEKRPYVKIIEQPAGKALRFRYECEGRSAGSIPGVSSTADNKTYPSIEIVGHKGRAVVVVSCVTKDSPYRPHPHNLVGKEGCKKGVCTMEINSQTMRAVFSNLGIQCVKKKDIDAALKAREEIRVDPFKTGFEHRCQPSSIDLNSVRLCFQVFIESGQKGRFTMPLMPVVSDPIYDKKAMSDLVICRLCSCSTTVLGNTQIMLLCEKVAKDDIAVRFYEEKNGQMTWEAYGDFQQTDVHKQTAIAFKTPRYHTLDIKEPAKVFIQLKRPSDGVTSEALPFEYIPLDTDPVNLRRKRQKTSDDTKYFLIQHQQQHTSQRQNQTHEHNEGRQTNLSNWSALLPPIKTEPRDTSPQPFGLYRNQAEMTPSPQPHSPSVMYNQNNPNLAYNLAPTPAPTPVLTTNQAQMSMSNEARLSPMDIQSSYGAQPTQQQAAHTLLQRQQQQQQQQQQPQYQLYDSTTNWNSNATQSTAGTNLFDLHMMNNNANTVNNSQTANANADTLRNATNPFVMHNMMTDADTAGAAQTAWNIPPNNLHNQQQQQQFLGQQQQQQQQQYQEHSPNPAAIQEAQNNLQSPINTNGTANAETENNNDNGPTISNLLNFDSGQLLHIDSEDQQNIQLDTEDLQISNLSLSS